MYGIVYLARCSANGKPHVGITTHSLRVRWTSHLGQARKENPKWILHHAIRKYGPEMFLLSVLEECDSRGSLHEAEVRWIAELKSTSPSGYNMTIGGGGTSGCKRTDEWKRNLSQRMRGRIASEEARAKMSKAKKGKPLTVEHAAKLAESRRGSKRSDETKAKMSLASRGKKHSQETIERIRLAKIGKPLKASARVSLQRPVVADHIAFSGLHEAAKGLGVSASAIMRRIENNCLGYSSMKLRRRRRPRTPEQIDAMTLRVSKAVTVGGVRYPSMTAAAAALGITRSGVAYRLRYGVPGRSKKLQSH